MTDALSPRTKPWIVPAGMPIVRQGEVGTTMYVIVDGAADVMVGATHIATIGPGGLVGEMALLTGRPRGATVVARTTCWLMPIDEERFTALMQQTPALAMQVMEQLGERLHDTNQHVINPRPTPPRSSSVQGRPQSGALMNRPPIAASEARMAHRHGRPSPTRRIATDHAR